MKARLTSLKKILDLFLYHRELSPKEIIDLSKLQKSVVHKYLKQLLEEGKLQKKGNPPKTVYILSDKQKHLQGEIQAGTENIFSPLGYQEKNILEKTFLKFSPTGKLYTGASGMTQWCLERGFDIHQKASDYIKLAKYIESEQDRCGMLSADIAFGKSFDTSSLEKVFYADQYIYGEFGRGKLAEMTFFAKQSQNKKLIAESIAEVFPKLECLIQTEKFDAIAITPWSIERKNQLLAILKKELSLFQIPFIRIIKYSPSGIFIPQKSLKSKEERIENAKNTIFVDYGKAKNYKKVLLVDDFVGSGATLQETAKKLKTEGIEQVYGFAFVGNTNLNYEVIREI